MKNLLLYILVALTFVISDSQAQDPENPCKCCTEKHQQFNFWLGEWEVFAYDKLAGTNTIVFEQDSCVLVENWTSADGNFTGTSYNFYNQQKKLWQQVWVDNQGSQLELSGQLEDGIMILYSEEMIGQNNEKYINRITWTPNSDGSIRQHWEVSKDNKNTWTTAFDGLYKKKSP